jgi:hypothetical protein
VIIAKAESNQNLWNGHIWWKICPNVKVNKGITGIKLANTKALINQLLTGGKRKCRQIKKSSICLLIASPSLFICTHF